MRIIYKNLDNSVAILIPAEPAVQSCGIEAIARKDVPQDLPYWIVNDSDIPTDRSERDARELDETMNEPDGYGGESNQFTQEELEKFREVDNV